MLPEARLGRRLGGMLTVALIASVESLLSAVAVERMQPGTAHRTLDRELLGQGAANTVSGLVGGLPVTGVIVRSSANVRRRRADPRRPRCCTASGSRCSRSC